MADPLFWLALSFLLVVISLTAVLMVAIPALRELGRAARSAEKMFDTLSRELPPTLEAIRLTGLEITELTDDLTEGVQGAGQVVQQVNQSLTTAQTGAKRLNTGTKSFWAGAKVAWQSLTRDNSPRRSDGRDRPPRPQASPRNVGNEALESPGASRASRFSDADTEAQGAAISPRPDDNGRDRRSNGSSDRSIPRLEATSREELSFHPAPSAVPEAIQESTPERSPERSLERSPEKSPGIPQDRFLQRSEPDPNRAEAD